MGFYHSNREFEISIDMTYIAVRNSHRGIPIGNTPKQPSPKFIESISNGTDPIILWGPSG